VLFVYVMVD